MGSSSGGTAPSGDKKRIPFPGFLLKLRKRHIIETLAAFIGGGWLIIEFVHFILIGHYHFPEKTLDITLITLICALLCTLVYRWFSGRETPRKFKLELVLIPLVFLVTILLDINLLLHLKRPESGVMPTPKWKKSVAVLPFKDLSLQKDQDWFCDGITSEIISRLSNISELKVPARTSAFFFKGKDQDIREIGNKLGVATILEGSIQKIERRLRVTVDLVNIADGANIWSQRFDRDIKDVFAIQDEIALAVADKLKITLLDQEKADVTKRYTNSIEANILYLKGRQSHLTLTLEELKKAIDYFKQALQIDPNYALAYSGLADIYYELPFYGPIRPQEAILQAKTYIKKALDIDDNLAEPHASLGRIVAVYDWNWEEAEQEFNRALKLNQNSSVVHILRASFLSVTGRHKEAILATERARQLDPLSSQVSSVVGEALFFSGQFDKAIADLKKTNAMDPSQFWTHWLLGASYQAKSMMKESIEELKKAVELSNGDPSAVSLLAVAYYRSGEKGAADKLLDGLLERTKSEYLSPFFLFLAYKARGDLNQAYIWLEKTCQDHDPSLPYSLIWPDDAYRIPYDQRSAELLKRVGLTKAAKE